MKVVLQRTRAARVLVEGECAGSIERGVVVLVGVHRDDTPAVADYLAGRCADLRIFADESGKMNRSLVETGGEALVISQFTLCGDTSRGRRPGFTEAAHPDKGKWLYEQFCDRLRTRVTKVETGVFGAHMQVELINDGPVTLLLEKNAAE